MKMNNPVSAQFVSNHSMAVVASSVLPDSRDDSSSKVLNSLSQLISESDSSQLPPRKWAVVLAIVCIIAICASGYLGWVALTSSKVAGCGGGKLFNCGHVISSRWSLWMGIPVSLLAVGTYLTLAGALFVVASPRFSSRARHIGWAMVTVLALSAGGAAIWFILLQLFALGHLCSYCLVAHACGLVATATVLWTRPVGSSGLKLAAALSVVGVAVLVGGQLLTAEPETFRIQTFETPATKPEVFEFEAPVFEAPPALDVSIVPLLLPRAADVQAAISNLLHPVAMMTSRITQEASKQSNASKPSNAGQSKDVSPQAGSVAASNPQAQRRMVSINGGTIQLDVAQWPLAGSTKAKYIFVEMFDYSCPHCRHTHAAIKGATERLKGDLAVVVLPIPLASACNNMIQVTDPKFTESCEVSKLAVAVWRVDAAKFTEFHNWMFANEAAPTYAMAKAQADKLVDAEKLNAELASKIPAQYIAKTVELYKRAGSGNVPKMIFPTTTVVGEFTSADSLVEIIKRQIKD